MNEDLVTNENQQPTRADPDGRRTASGDVRWDQLHHAYGIATDVPGLLRQVTDPETAVAAIGDLSIRIYHQGGTVYSAAPAAAPVLVELAIDRTVVVRPTVLELLGDLARTGRTALPEHIAPSWPTAWAAAVPRLLDLLDDPDPAVRRRLGFPLAQAVNAADTVLAAVRDRWAVEPDQAARLGLVLTSGQLLRHARRVDPTATVAWLTELSADADGDLRLAAVLALRRAAAPSPGRQRFDPRHVDVMVAVLPDTDLKPWTATWCAPGRPEYVIDWVDRMLGADRDGRTRLSGALQGLPAPDRRASALRTAAEVITRWRSPVPRLLPGVADRLSDPDGDNRTFAGYLLATCGQPAARWADQLAAAVADAHPSTADAAVYALARLGDQRCVAPLVDRLAGDRLGFALHTSHGGGWWPRPPGLRDVLGDLAQYAEPLLPALRARLRDATDLDGRRAYAQVLAAWGAAAAPAIPDLDALLDTESVAWGLDALAAIGPAAARALPRRRLSVAATRPDLHPYDRKLAVRAWWRLTGDPGPALDLLLPDLDHRLGAAGTAKFLAELGPAALPYLDRLRELTQTARGGWLSTDIGTALWRITGDPTEALSALTPVIDRMVEHRSAGPAQIRVITVLGEIGPAAAAVLPVLEWVVDTDRRPVPPGDWTSVPLDDELRRAAATALARVSGTSVAARETGTPSPTPSLTPSWSGTSAGTGGAGRPARRPVVGHGGCSAR